MVRAEVDRDWEIAAVCRHYFATSDSITRPALLFENVRGFRQPVVVGAVGGSVQIYARALNTEAGQIMKNANQKWDRALNESQYAPVWSSQAPCQENVLKGEDCRVDAFPHPIWTRGLDPGYFLTAGCFISKDPETGIVNVGLYRSQLKGPRKLGVHFASPSKHMHRHISKNERENRPTPVVIALGVDPTLTITAISNVPYNLSEMNVAGALRGDPIRVVRAVNSDLPVPAGAEIVIEGKIHPGDRSEEGPFGEYTGYMGPKGNSYDLEVECITFRNQPLYQCLFSQMPPSESSLVRNIQKESRIYSFLKDSLGLEIRDVHLPESGSVAAYLYIALKKHYPQEVWQAAWGAWAVDPTIGKFTVVTDDDVNIRNPFEREWAMGFSVQPRTDIQVLDNTPGIGLDPSLGPRKSEARASKVLVDATRKLPYPPKSLPPEEDMRKVREQYHKYWGER